MLEQVLVLLDEFLWSEPTIFIEQVNFKNLLFVFSVSRSEKGCNDEWEIISESSVSDVGGENVVVVWIEELFLS